MTSRNNFTPPLFWEESAKQISAALVRGKGGLAEECQAGRDWQIWRASREKWTFFFWLLKHLTQLVQDFNSKIEALNYTNNVISLKWWACGANMEEVSHFPSFHQHQALLESFKQRLGEGQSGEKVDTEFRCLLEKNDAERGDFWLKIHDRWS